LDFRRAGLFRQHQQRQRWPVPPPQQLLRSFVRRASSDLCSSRCLCAKLCGSRRLCSSLCTRRRAKLLRAGPDLLQHRLQQLLPQALLLQDAEALLPEDLPAQDLLPEDPLLQGSQLLQQRLRSDLCRSGRLCSDLCRSSRLRSDLCRSGCLRSDLCRSGCLLPLV
jgi:hypothetical protein